MLSATKFLEIQFGGPASVAHDHAERFRQHDEKLLREQHLVYDDEDALMRTSKGARADLEKLFEADAEEANPKP